MGDNSVYVLGEPWGDSPFRIAAISELSSQVTDSTIIDVFEYLAMEMSDILKNI